MSLPDPNHQTLVEHLTELRVRVVRAAWAILAGFLASWAVKDRLVSVIREPIKPFLKNTEGSLIFTGVMDSFTAHLKVSLLGGIILSCPFWMYQLWKFVSPGLYQHERKYAGYFIGFGTIMFLIGVSFAYFLVYPAAFSFLLMFGGENDVAMISLAEYLNFFVTTTLIFGAAFELPLVLVILGLLGVVDQKFLRAKRRYAVVILATLAAVVTPPDAISMMMLLVPLWLLYEASILIIGWLRPVARSSADLVVQPAQDTHSKP